MTPARSRKEKDSLGVVEVPADALYGAQTQRAIGNFPVSGVPLPPRFIRALGLVKAACARANAELGTLEPSLADAIEKAAMEVSEGLHDAQFPIDVYQTGSGTSTNMNANEVIANRAAQLLGAAVGTYDRVHPNDHANRSQSSNDVIPTTMHVAAALAIQHELLPAIEKLHLELAKKAREFDGIVKIGRTHLQDAVPIRLGQEFSGYAQQVKRGADRVSRTMEGLYELAIGGTALGTGLNAHPEFGAGVARILSERTGLAFREAPNHFEAQAARDAYVFTSGALNTYAASLMKIANDLRLLASGPATGLREIHLPDLQPGSSIMPGKVNPVIPEVVTQVAAQVAGNNVAVTIGGLGGQLDLNVMCPMMARNLLESVHLLTSASHLLADKCVKGLTANTEVLEGYLERSNALATALNPLIGYAKAAEIAKESTRTGKTVRELVVEKGILTKAEADRVLDLRRLTEPGEPDKAGRGGAAAKTGRPAKR